MEQYRHLAETILLHQTLDWFDLKDIQIKTKGETKELHLYLDEN